MKSKGLKEILLIEAFSLLVHVYCWQHERPFCLNIHRDGLDLIISKPITTVVFFKIPLLQQHLLMPGSWGLSEGQVLHCVLNSKRLKICSLITLALPGLCGV